MNNQTERTDELPVKNMNNQLNNRRVQVNGVNNLNQQPVNNRSQRPPVNNQNINQNYQNNPNINQQPIRSQPHVRMDYNPYQPPYHPGYNYENSQDNRINTSNKSLVSAILLCYFFGMFGAHRFYCGWIGTGIVMLLLTISLFLSWVTAIWLVCDFVRIVCGTFPVSTGGQI